LAWFVGRAALVMIDVKKFGVVLQDDLADSAMQLLPKRIQPDSWSNPDKPEATGTIHRFATEPTLYDHSGEILATRRL
jgi:hypothetical protein